MSAPERRAILVLGGTEEAAALAGRLVAAWGDRFDIVTSLAGRTRAPAVTPGEIRVGGFGGAAAMARYLAARRVCALVDATHPFAARISENARIAGIQAGVPRVALLRPPWDRAPGDDWRPQRDLAAAAALLPAVGRRAFLTIGRTELAAFAGCAGVRFLVRLIDAPEAPVPLPDCHVITGRGPFALPDELQLMEDHKIDVLVCKSSGGAATRAKLDAARQRAIPVLMIERPAPVPGPAVDNVDAVLDWVGAQVA